MYKFEKYVFSPEVKSNLGEFLRVVNRNPSTPYDKMWETLLPKNLDLINELNSYVGQSEVTVDLTDEESLLKEQTNVNKTADDLLEDDITVMDNDFKGKLSASSVENMADSLKQYLCSDENLDDTFCDLFSNYSNDDLVEIFKLLFGSLNIELIRKLGSFSLNTNSDKKSEIIRLCLKYLLIPKLFIDTNKEVSSIFAKFLEHSFTITLKEISHKLIDGDMGYPKHVLSILNALEVKHKQQLLRDFVSSTSKLHQSHFPMIDVLLYSDLQVETLQEIMKVLTASSSMYSDDKVFGKLLLNVVKCAKNNVIHFKQQLDVIVGIHQSIWKNTLQKEIGDYLANTSTLSQSWRY